MEAIQIICEFPLGARVRVVSSEDVVGVVSMYIVRPGHHVSYGVSWMHDGEARSSWFDAVELESAGVCGRTIGIPSPRTDNMGAS